MNVGFSGVTPRSAVAPSFQRQVVSTAQASPVFSGRSGKGSDSGNLLLIGLAGAALAFIATTLLRNQPRQVPVERPVPGPDSDLDRPLVIDKDLDGFR